MADTVNDKIKIKIANLVDENLAVKIVVSRENEQFAKDIMYGIEEEEIPYNIEYVPNNEINVSNVNNYAYEQAKKSKLSLGIAVIREKAVFHFARLEENKPLFVLNHLEDADSEEKRIFGSNMARMVKGIPLKDITKNI